MVTAVTAAGDEQAPRAIRARSFGRLAADYDRIRPGYRLRDHLAHHPATAGRTTVAYPYRCLTVLYRRP